jgi:large subunit ribosomal protein L19
MAKRSTGAAAILKSLNQSSLKRSVPQFKAGDTIKVHARIVEGNKERIQIFQGVVISRKGRNGPKATFTVRKVSYNIGVERIFMLHSPRVEKIEVVTQGLVRRAKLFYLRETKGKAGKVKSRLVQKIGADIILTEDSAEDLASELEADTNLEDTAEVTETQAEASA